MTDDKNSPNDKIVGPSDGLCLHGYGHLFESTGLKVPIYTRVPSFIPAEQAAELCAGIMLYEIQCRRCGVSKFVEA